MEYLEASFVILGEGFEPGALDPARFSEVLPGPAETKLKMPVASEIAFSDGYSVAVLPNRLIVKHHRPTEGGDRRMVRAVEAIFKLWPSAKASAAGVNLVLAGVYDGLSQDKLTGTLAPKGNLEETFGASVVGSVSSFVLNAHGAKVTLKVTTDAIIEEKAGYQFDLNAHYQPVGNLAEILGSQSFWQSRLSEWAGALTK